MIGYISCLISFILCAIIYTKMVKREEPSTLGKKSIVPVALGFVSPILTFILMILVRLMIVRIVGGSVSTRVQSPLIRSLAKAFFGAGLPEEIVKMLLALLAVSIVKPKNVYTYALMFIGVGFGFTALEEILYGVDNDLFSLARIPGFALHMVFDMIMGVNFGLARFKKKQGKGGTSLLVLAALILPILWHTIYDAATVDNEGLKSESDIALILALLIDIGSIVLQFVLLSKFKKKSKELCQMEF